MIADVRVGKDAAGYPVVTWTEARGFGPRERVECRIMKTADGVLTFVARGAVRLGEFEEGRPWQLLQGFAIKTAEELYREPVEHAMVEHIGKRSPILGAALRDNGKVLVATFRIGMPLHLNCADAPIGQLQRLHAILSEAFVHGAQQGLAAGWRCAADDARIESYDPARTKWPDEPERRSLLARVLAGMVSLTQLALALAILAFLAYIGWKLVRVLGA